MRLVDQPTVHVETRVAAPPAVVWDLVTDLDLPARFSEEFLGATWDPPRDEPEVGARFIGRNHNDFMGEWTVPCWVSEFEPGRRFGWVSVDPDEPGARWRFEVEPDGDGTILRHWAQVGPGFSGLVIAVSQRPDKEERIVAGRLEQWRANMSATIEGIKAIAEERA